MINRSKYLITAIILAMVAAICYTNSSPLFIVLIIYLSGRMIFMHQWSALSMVMLVGVIFSVRLMCVPQPTNQQYQTLTLKIRPTQFKQSGDVYTGIANNSVENFSFLINKTAGELIQPTHKIIYLKTNDFELSTIQGPTNIAEVNFKKYFFSKNVFRTLKINSFKMAQVKPQTIIDHVLLLRWQLSQSFEKLPPTLRFNAKGLLIGENDPTEQSKNYLNDFTKLGIIHLFSLSGMHLLILIAFLKKVCGWSRLCTVETLETALFIILPLYSLLVGANTSICRATILVLTKIAFSKFHYQQTSTEIFGISLIIGLFLDPKCLLLLGGQLTYLLSFSLIYLWNTSLFKLSFMINLLCTPLIILNNYEVNLVTIPVNMVIGPIFEWFILPSTAIFSAFGWINPQLTEFVDFLNATIYNVGHNLSQIQLFQIVTGKFSLVIVLIMILLILIIISDKYYRAISARILVGLFLVSFLVNKIPITGQVTLLDIGQGDSILLTTPIKREVFLIDTGGKLAFGGHSIRNFNVDKITIPYLKSQGITKINAVFMSHQDSDHIGDLAELLRNFPIKRVYFGNGMQNNPKVRKVLLPYNNRVKIMAVGAGDVVKFSTNEFRVLAPLKPGPGENDDSMVLATKICQKNWLFTGDLPRDQELAVMNKYHPKVDYLKVGHHGSKTSSDPDFIRQIHPEAAFISVGRKNRYGHPNKETIDTLNANQVQIFQTAEYGMIKWQYDLFGNRQLIRFLGK